MTLLVLAGGGCSGGRHGATYPSGADRTAPASFRPGAPGVGDPYFPTYGNGGYDARHYTLQVRYDPATDQLSGSAVIDARATVDLSRFNLDLVGLTVRKVLVDGVAARFERSGDELVVTPAAGLPAGSAFTVGVTYDGSPTGQRRDDLGATGFLHTADGAFVMGQPESAASWYPVNDHPLDKATYSIAVTAPQSLAAVSNGVLVGEAAAGPGWRTTTWRVSQPMASYLSTLAIGRYRVSTTTHKGKPMVVAVAASLPTGPADQAMARTGEIADFLERWFGPYPFDAYGGIVVDDDRVAFALETQTRPIYADSFFASADGTWVVAHEVAHQWFGNSVSVRHWKDMWLNEGLATYAQWMWQEHTGGRTVQAQFDSQYDSLKDWAVRPAEPGVDEIFSEAVYQRGAMAVHALRRAIGDEDFARLLRTWAVDKRDGNATTTDFVAVAERVSGQKVRPVLDAWLYGSQRPPKP